MRVVLPLLIALVACAKPVREPPPQPPSNNGHGGEHVHVHDHDHDHVHDREPDPVDVDVDVDVIAPKKPPDPPTATPYDRTEWPQWIDADHDCQDTRTEVLIAESEIPVTFTTDKQCTVATGRWRCPYTDRTFTDPKLLDIDHLVPLEHAHESGGFAWSKQKRTDFANALDDPDHLIAVYRSSNRSKGSRSIEVWLPEEPGFRCEYTSAWRRIKQTWKLKESSTERRAIDDALAKCRAKDVPERPTASTTTPKTTDDHDPPKGACCKICKTGKACGDGCISIDKTCRKPPGCACSQ